MDETALPAVEELRRLNDNLESLRAWLAKLDVDSINKILHFVAKLLPGLVLLAWCGSLLFPSFQGALTIIQS